MAKSFYVGGPIVFDDFVNLKYRILEANKVNGGWAHS